MEGPGRWLREHLRGLEPYTTARDLYGREGRLLLDANENAYGTLAPEFGADLHRYPDPGCGPLRGGLAEWLDVDPAALWIGNGSDEALQLLLRAFVEPGGPVTIAVPTYGMYAIAARSHPAVVREVELDESFDLDVDASLRTADGSTLVFVCSPNNPTGNLLSPNRVLQLAERHDGLVVVDEAYVEFSGGGSLVPKLGERRNLIVLRTFSKAWGLAGARVGYLVADPEVITYLDRISLPYPLSAPSAEAARLALGRVAEMEGRVQRLVGERDRLVDRLRRLGLDALPSDANFLLIRVPNASSIQRQLAEAYGIIVRDRSGLPRLKEALRITVGQPEENDRLCAALEEILA